MGDFTVSFDASLDLGPSSSICLLMLCHSIAWVWQRTGAQFGGGAKEREIEGLVTENIHTESYLSEKSVRCFFDCVCKCVCKWRHRVKYTEGYLSEKSVRCFCDYCVCKWRVQMECTCVPPCSQPVTAHAQFK